MNFCQFQVASIHLSVRPPTTIIPSSFRRQSLTYFSAFTSLLSFLCASSIHNLSALCQSFVVISFVYGSTFGFCSTEQYFWFSLTTRAVVFLCSSFNISSTCLCPKNCLDALSKIGYTGLTNNRQFFFLLTSCQVLLWNKPIKLH